ncbi:MAG: hypothetical protein KDD62_05000 [Bdellovibrionales bacterium]|nr:hypothetical protein [Bdellovibrionales bacterium]
MSATIQAIKETHNPGLDTIELSGPQISLNLFRSGGLEQFQAFLVTAYGKSGFSIEVPLNRYGRYEPVRINPTSERVSEDDPVDRAVVAFFNISAAEPGILNADEVQSFRKALEQSVPRINEILDNSNEPQNSSILRYSYGMNIPLDTWNAAAKSAFVERLRIGLNDLIPLVEVSSKQNMALYFS